MTVRQLKGDEELLFASAGPERDAALDRIIKATGLKPDDRAQLAESIESAIIQLSHQEHLASLRVTQAEIQAVTSIKKYLSKAQKLAQKFLTIRSVIGKTIDRAIADLGSGETRVDIKIGDRVVEVDLKQRKKGSRQPSAMELFAGLYLPLVFEQHFGAPVTRSRDAATGTPKGPGINFILAVTKEVGLRCSAGLISRAITRLRKEKEEARFFLD
jgi:hypothetical protein